MKLNQLKYFLVVAEVGKISQAAKILYISPPALSSTISNLEKELGVQLFERDSNSIKLNKQGEIFLRYVKQVFNNLDCAKLEIQRSLEESSNTVRIAVTSSSLWVPLISAFTNEYRDIMLSFTTLKIAQLQDDSFLRQFSFILAEHDDFAADGMNSIRLCGEKLVALIPSEHPLAEKTEIMLSDLIDELLFLPMPGQSLNRRIKQIFREQQLPLNHIHECADTTCRLMVEEGRGISFTTSHAVPSKVTTMKCVPIKAIEPQWEQRLYWQRDRILTREEICFKDFVETLYQPELR